MCFKQKGNATRPPRIAEKVGGMDERGWGDRLINGMRPFLHIALRFATFTAFQAALSLPVTGRVRAEEPIQLRIIGGLAGVSQYVRHEEPFWRDRVPQMTGGRVRATINPFDSSGLRGQEMLQLMRLGVVPFGTALLAAVSADEPELNAVDLPGLNPDIAALRRTVALYRPHLERLLRDRYGIELLGIYAYPAQVIYCTKAFTGLGDLAGRRIRTSSVGQSEMMSALGALPVVTPFAEVVNAVRAGTVDCAITGTLSGNEIGLFEVTSHIHAMAISWALSFFGANSAVWDALPADLRDVLRGGIKGLENDIWEASDRETAEGLACDTGSSTCIHGRVGQMTLVPVTPADDAQRARVLVRSVLPAWVERCGKDCARAWNSLLAPGLRLNTIPIPNGNEAAKLDTHH